MGTFLNLQFCIPMGFGSMKNVPRGAKHDPKMALVKQPKPEPLLNRVPIVESLCFLLAQSFGLKQKTGNSSFSPFRIREFSSSNSIKNGRCHAQVQRCQNQDRRPSNELLHVGSIEIK